MLLRHSVIVMVIIGDSIKNTKCHILSSKAFLILTLKAVKRPIITGAIRAKPNNNHLEANSSFKNCELKNTTKSTSTPAIDAPVIFEFLVEEISNVFTKKFFIVLKILGTVVAKKCDTVFILNAILSIKQSIKNILRVKNAQQYLLLYHLILKKTSF